MRRGFTLIELLVVIAIIAVLAAILFPVFAKAREKTRQSTCLSAMCNTGKALLAYANDHSGYMPSRLPTPPWVELRPYLTNVYQPAATDDALYSSLYFSCPSDGRSNPPAMMIGKAPLALSWGFREEAFSSSVFATSRDRYPVVIDCISKDGLWRQADVGDSTPEHRLINLPENRHNLGINVLFHDGHADWSGTSMFCQKIATGEYKEPLSYPLGVVPVAEDELPKAIVGDDGVIRDARTKLPIATTK